MLKVLVIHLCFRGRELNLQRFKALLHSEFAVVNFEGWRGWAILGHPFKIKIELLHFMFSITKKEAQCLVGS